MRHAVERTGDMVVKTTRMASLTLATLPFTNLSKWCPEITTRIIRQKPSLKATEIASAWRVQTFHVLLGVLFLAGTALQAQQTPENLEKIARNPVADAVKIPFAESINFDAGPYGRTSNSLQIQPVIPFEITGNLLLIPRILATLVAYE